MKILINHKFRSFLEQGRHPETASAILHSIDGAFYVSDMLSSSTDFEMSAKLVFKLGKFVISLNNRNSKATLVEKSDNFLMLIIISAGSLL